MILLEWGQLLAPAVGLWLLLCVLGRLVASPVLGGGRLGMVLRLPGNLLHELAHAIGALIAGYRVSNLQLALFAADRRGRVQPGAPWAPWGRPALLRLLAAPAPLPAGVAVLCLLGAWMGSQPQLDQPRTWIAALLAISVVSEMAPSDVDLKILALPGLLSLLGLAGALALLHLLAPGSDALVSELLSGAAAALQRWALNAMLVSGLGLALAGLPILLLRRA